MSHVSALTLSLLIASGSLVGAEIRCFRDGARVPLASCSDTDRRYEVDPKSWSYKPPGGTHYKCPDGIWRKHCTSEQEAQQSVAEETEREGRYAENNAPFCTIPEPVPANSAEKCLDAYRPLLLDPRSAYVVSSAWARRRDDIHLGIEIRARNRMGGFEALHMTCGVMSDGSINAESTATLLELWQALRSLRVSEDVIALAHTNCN
jgi:hypothetical protein